jgi:transcription elongation factor Elf1
MEIVFSYVCGHEISEFTRSDRSDGDFQVACEECGAIYAVSLTQLQEGET